MHNPDLQAPAFGIGKAFQFTEDIAVEDRGFAVDQHTDDIVLPAGELTCRQIRMVSQSACCFLHPVPCRRAGMIQSFAADDVGSRNHADSRLLCDLFQCDPFCYHPVQPVCFFICLFNAIHNYMSKSCFCQ